MKTVLEKIKYNNLKIDDLVGDDSVFIMKIGNYEITFYDYDIDNNYDLRNRIIYKLDDLNIDSNVNISLLIWMEDNELLEKVTISSKKVFVKTFKKDKLFKEEIIESK